MQREKETTVTEPSADQSKGSKDEVMIEVSDAAVTTTGDLFASDDVVAR